MVCALILSQGFSPAVACGFESTNGAHVRGEFLLTEGQLFFQGFSGFCLPLMNSLLSVGEMVMAEW